MSGVGDGDGDEEKMEQKDGVEKEFTLENYPDSTWTFVDSRTIVKKKGYEPPIHDFSMILHEDGDDITDQVLSDEGYTFLLVAHQLGQASDRNIDLINELYDYCLEYGYAFYCLTSSTDEDIQKWQVDTGAEYPFCLMDNITLKTMVRSNPGLMLLKKGVVVNKWSVTDIPDEYQLTGVLEQLPIGKVNKQSFVYQLFWVVVWFVLPLLLMCLADMAWKRFRENQELLKKED